MTETNTSETSFISLNHSSLLIKYQDECLLTDPWFQMPGLGSWLPVPPLVIHPAYLTSIDKLSILISHAHDDHCDDKFLSLFNKDTVCVTSDFASAGTKRRISKIGFTNILDAPNTGIQVSKFFKIYSYRNDEISKDDALYVIKTPDAIIIHSNDCWFPLTDDCTNKIKGLISTLPDRNNAILLSQSNSASGYPLTYLNFSPEQKKIELFNKVEKMILGGARNATILGVKKFGGYAGYSLPFVESFPDYILNSLYVDPEFLSSILKKSDFNGEIIGLMPGEEYMMTGKATRLVPFNSRVLKQRSIEYYREYGLINACDSYNPIPVKDPKHFQECLTNFLNKFNNFVMSHIEKTGYYSSIIGKTLALNVSDQNFLISVTFGVGVVNNTTFNKSIKTTAAMFNRVLLGNSLFENLYTGYIAEIERRPVEVYNKDIITYICMFSYYYRNNIAENNNLG